jgi:hypothetical protein
VLAVYLAISNLPFARPDRVVFMSSRNELTAHLSDPGFRIDGLVMAQIDLPGDLDGRASGVEQLLGRVAALPGVHAVAASSHPAYSGGQGVQLERLELWKGHS